MPVPCFPQVLDYFNLLAFYINLLSFNSWKDLCMNANNLTLQMVEMCYNVNINILHYTEFKFYILQPLLEVTLFDFEW